MSLVVQETRDLAACHALRRTVFIEEQGVSAAEEMDGRDDEAVHILATLDGRPVGCARILFEGGSAKVGRVCVLGSARGRGFGRALMAACVTAAGARAARQVKLGAQLSALGFYEKLGFEAYGPIFDDAGIDHRMMARAP